MEPQEAAQPAAPVKETQAQGDTHKPAQVELDLGKQAIKPKQATPSQAQPAPIPTPPDAGPAQVPVNLLGVTPQPETKKAPKTDPKRDKIDPEELTRLSTDYESLRKSHDALQESIIAAQGDLRIQVIRKAGVEALGDEEILKLAPQVDPNTTSGREAINKWIDEHPGLVSPKYKIQTPQSKQIAAAAIENKAVKSLWGTAESVKRTIKTLTGE